MTEKQTIFQWYNNLCDNEIKRRGVLVLKRKIAITALSLSLGFGAFTYTTAHAESLSDIHKKQAENAAKKAKKNKEMSKVKEQQKDLLNDLSQINEKLATTENEIESKKQAISKTKSEIEKLQKEIKVLEKRIKERDAILKERVRSMYESGGSTGYLDVILGSKSFGDFIDRMVSLNVIAQSDENILKEQREDKKNVEEKKVRVESKLASLNAKLNELNALKSDLNKQKADKKNIVKKLKKKEDHIDAEMKDLKERDAILAAQEEAVKAEIERAKKEEAARKAREAAAAKAAQAKAAQASKPASSGHSSSSSSHSSSSPEPTPAPTPSGHGMFIKPAAGAFTSGFGSRSGEYSGFHPGVDIAAPGTVPIVAAADGTVIRSYKSSSYGNCVFISHYIDGQLYTTVYAHMRSRQVSNGQTVHQGQVIGYMGSTGWSTGQHLHFEIHKGEWNYQKSNAVNPMQYIN